MFFSNDSHASFLLLSLDSLVIILCSFRLFWIMNSVLNCVWALYFRLSFSQVLFNFSILFVLFSSVPGLFSFLSSLLPYVPLSYQLFIGVWICLLLVLVCTTFFLSCILPVKTMMFKGKLKVSCHTDFTQGKSFVWRHKKSGMVEDAIYSAAEVVKNVLCIKISNAFENLRIRR